MSMDRRLLTIIGIALGVVLLLAVNIASHRLFSGTRLEYTGRSGQPHGGSCPRVTL